jgi:hypothetical protein
MIQFPPDLYMECAVMQAGNAEHEQYRDYRDAGRDNQGDTDKIVP